VVESKVTDVVFFFLYEERKDSHLYSTSLNMEIFEELEVAVILGIRRLEAFVFYFR